MKKIVFLVVHSMLASSWLYATDSHLLGGIELKNSMTLVGMEYPKRYSVDGKQYTEDLTKSFCVQGAEKLRKLPLEISHGPFEKEEYGNLDYHIFLIEDGKVIYSWIIDRYSSTVYMNGAEYVFDPSQIDTLAKNYPFDYNCKYFEFDSSLDIDAYVSEKIINGAFAFPFEIAKPSQEPYLEFFTISMDNPLGFENRSRIFSFLLPWVEENSGVKIYRIRLQSGSIENNEMPLVFKVMVMQGGYVKMKAPEGFIIGDLIPERYEVTMIEKK